MTGVEILTSNEVAIEYAFNWTVFWIVGGIALVIITAIGIYSYVNGECDFGIIPSLFIIGICAGSMLGSTLGRAFETPKAYTTEYQVTISDDVSMTEFYEHYEVIDQDGKIFTVREKSENEG